MKINMKNRFVVVSITGALVLHVRLLTGESITSYIQKSSVYTWFNQNPMHVLNRKLTICQ